MLKLTVNIGVPISPEGESGAFMVPAAAVVDEVIDHILHVIGAGRHVHTRLIHPILLDTGEVDTAGQPVWMGM